MAPLEPRSELPSELELQCQTQDQSQDQFKPQFPLITKDRVPRPSLQARNLQAQNPRFHLFLMVIVGVSWLWGCAPTSAISSQPTSPPSVISSSPSSSPAAMSTPSPLAQGNADRFLGQYLPVLAQVQLGEALISLEVTQTPQEQALGLMFRPSLEDDRGMLFEFNPARPVSFWMKNVVISLDMLFVREGKLIAIAAEVPPCNSIPCPTYGPAEAIDQVIELRGGRAAELGLKPGDPVVVEWLGRE